MPALSLKNNESTVESLRKYFGGELHLKEKNWFHDEPYYVCFV